MNKVYIGNIPYSTNEDDLTQFFSSCGDIESVALIRDRDTGRLKGFGFITFITGDAAQKALKLDSQEFKGRNIKVSLAREKAEGGAGKRPSSARRWEE